jgi:hypothetical protein
MAAGTRDNQSSAGAASGPLGAAARGIGFTALAGMAIAILAGVVLLPPAARLQRARHHRDCLAAYNQDAQTLIRVHDRLIEDLPDDDILTLRLLRQQQDLVPRGEVVVENPAFTATPPDLAVPQPSPRPAAPDNLVTRAADRIANPRTRRGLLLLAAMAMIAAMLLFAPPRRNA